MKLSLFAFAALAGAASAQLDPSPFAINAIGTDPVSGDPCPDGGCDGGLTVSYDDAGTFTATLVNNGGGFHTLAFAYGECGHGDPTANDPDAADWWNQGAYVDLDGVTWLGVGSATPGAGVTTWDFSIGPGVEAQGCPVYQGPGEDCLWQNDQTWPHRKLNQVRRRLCPGGGGDPSDPTDPDPTCPPCDEKAYVKMCMKAAIATSEGGPVVNFREVELTVEYELCAGFDPVTFYTLAYTPRAVDPGDAVSFNVVANLCSGPVHYQGQQICIDVCPETASDYAMIEVTDVQSMFVTENDWFDILQSVGATTDTAEIVTAGAPGDLTTFMGTDDDDDDVPPQCYRVKFLLPEIFFPWNQLVNPSETVDEDAVSPECAGSVIVSFLDTPVAGAGGASRRLEKRSLQEQTAEFKTNFVIAKSPDSGSYIVEKVTVTAALMGAAAMVL